MSYLSDFLFSPERANSPVRTLSGGERNRLLLARLFALPANVLVLDEPTNDLDIDTLELLEELLQSYAGTVFLVSHDRRFLDNVVTSTIAWEGDPAFGGRPGLWREYEGGYEDWALQRAARAATARAGRPCRQAARGTPSGRGRQPAPARRREAGQAQLQGAARTRCSCRSASRRSKPSRRQLGEVAAPIRRSMRAIRRASRRRSSRMAEIEEELMARARALGGAGRPSSGAGCRACGAWRPKLAARTAVQWVRRRHGRCTATLALDVAEGDPALAQVVGRHLERNRIAGKNADVVLLHAARGIGHQLMAVLQRDAKTGIRQHLGHGALHLDQFFLGQTGLLETDCP